MNHTFFFFSLEARWRGLLLSVEMEQWKGRGAGEEQGDHPGYPASQHGSTSVSVPSDLSWRTLWHSILLKVLSCTPFAGSLVREWFSPCSTDLRALWGSLGIHALVKPHQLGLQGLFIRDLSNIQIKSICCWGKSLKHTYNVYEKPGFESWL